MIPEQLKEMFGLKTQSDMNTANNIWKMLDEMAQSNPDNYKTFIDNNLKKGLLDAKKESFEKNKPFLLKPRHGFCLMMQARLKVKSINQNQIEEKILITKKKWEDIEKSFMKQTKIFLNICYSQRVKEPQLKVQKYTPDTIKQIKNLYYSLQGPVKDQKAMYFCMIFPARLFCDLCLHPQGKRSVLALGVCYLQERLINDKNICFQSYSQKQYQKIAYYDIQKETIQILPIPYLWLNKEEIEEFLLEAQIDTMRKEQIKNNPPAKVQLKYKKQETQQKIIKQEPLKNVEKKKCLVEVLKEQNIIEEDFNINYELKTNQQGYSIDFFLPGIVSFSEIDLQTSQKIIRIKTNFGRHRQITLQKQINVDKVVAKFKNKSSTLSLRLSYK